MKSVFTLLAAILLLTLLVNKSLAQTNTFPSTGSAGIGTLTPNASSLLEIKSTTKGILIPRMTKTQRDAIASPATGLMIFQTNSSPGFYYYDGSAWKVVTTKAGWSLTGNANTDSSINFMGTTDAHSLVFRVNNLKAGIIDYNKANTGFGLQSLFSNTTGTYNCAIGTQALLNNTSGVSNTAIGYEALELNSTGSANVANGFQALVSNTTGQQNTATGYASLYSNGGGNYNSAHGIAALNGNTDGTWNTATGAYAMFLNTHGGYNTASGGYALYSNTNSFNTATGYSALFTNTAGSGNTANGYEALYSNDAGLLNTANGYEALYSNTFGANNNANGANALYSNKTGSNNTANGANALFSNTTGKNNNAIGTNALYNNINGFSNVAIGISALHNNTDRSNLVAVGDSALFNNGMDVVYPYEAARNTAIGSKALYSNTNGHQNTANGFEALYSNTDGFANTANGSRALYSNIGIGNTAFGVEALYDNTSGSSNTALGVGALFSNTTGNYNTALGNNADISTGGLFNATAIGANAIVDASNKVRVGDVNITSIGGKVGWTTFPSDGRYKKNIKEDVKGLAFINNLKPITYTIDIDGLNTYYDKNRKHDEAYDKMKKDMQPAADEASKIVYNGFIAQDVEAAAKKLNYEFSGVDKPKTKDGLYGLRYGDFVVPLVKAVQELSRMNDDKDAQIQQQNANISDLEARLLKLEAVVNAQGAGTNQVINITNASLQQNVPNPFNHSTTINYTLPQTYSSAKIIVADKSGKILKEVNVSAKGKGSIQVDLSTLASGAYQYSLYVDGKLIDTKQMVSAK